MKNSVVASALSAVPSLLGLALVGLVLVSCGNEDAATAKKKLAEKQVPVDEQTLLAKTKDGKGGEEAARLLVLAGVDPNARQENGMTVLMSAAYNGQLDVATTLLAKGADVNAAAKGYTALRLAVERGNVDMIKLLLQRGADPDLRPQGAPSARQVAEDSSKPDVVQLLKGK